MRQFIEGCRRARHEAEGSPTSIWDLIIKFAGYGFNKSHSTAYALIAYQTAYLKAHYSVEFMAALLSGDIPGRNFKRKDALVEHLEDCGAHGYRSRASRRQQSSDVDFRRCGTARIFFGLSAIKGCGGSAAEALVDSTNARTDRYKSIFDRLRTRRSFGL